MSFRAQLRLITCLLDENKNFFKLSLPMGTIICLHNGPLVVILMHSLKTFELFTVLWISSIFLLESLEKFSLSLRMFCILEDETCTYNYAGAIGLLADFPLPDFLLDTLVEIWEGGMLVNSTGLTGEKWLDLLLVGTTGICIVNSFLILSQNIFWLSPASKLSYFPLKWMRWVQTQLYQN